MSKALEKEGTKEYNLEYEGFYFSQGHGPFK